MIHGLASHLEATMTFRLIMLGRLTNLELAPLLESTITFRLTMTLRLINLDPAPLLAAPRTFRLIIPNLDPLLGATTRLIIHVVDAGCYGSGQQFLLLQNLVSD